MYKKIASIRKEKNSPFLIRKSKLLSWLSTLVSIGLWIGTIAVFALIIVSVLDVTKLGEVSNITDANKVFDLIYSPFSLLNTFLSLLLVSFIVFIAVKIFATIMNIIRYISDYKRNVVPLKGVLTFRLIFQLFILLFLCFALVGIIYSIVEIIQLVKEPLNQSLNLISEFQNKLTPNMTEEKIKQLFDSLKSEFEPILNNLENLLNTDFSKYIIPSIIAIGSILIWILLLVIYGLIISIVLRSKEKYLGDQTIKKVKKNKETKQESQKINDKQENDNKELETKEEKNDEIIESNNEQNNDTIKEEKTKEKEEK